MAPRGREGDPPEAGRRVRPRVLSEARVPRLRETALQRKRPRTAGPFFYCGRTAQRPLRAPAMASSAPDTTERALATFMRM